MLATVHDFDTSLAKGKAGEARVRAGLESLTPLRFIDSTPEQDRTGIDCFDQHGRSWQIKTEDAAQSTFNVFVEIHGNTESKVGGGPMHCAADWWLCYAVGYERCYIHRTKHLYELMNGPWRGYPVGKSKNTDKRNGGHYHSTGLLIPISTYASTATKRISINKPRLVTKEECNKIVDGLFAHYLKNHATKFDEFERYRYRNAMQMLLVDSEYRVTREALRRTKELYSTYLPAPFLIEDQLTAAEKDIAAGECEAAFL
jgi:hypothetical protein